MARLDFINPIATNTEVHEFAFIDWLRGIAALLVVEFHLDLHVFHAYPNNAIPPDSFTYHFVMGDIALGTYAVGVFFVVSGFLIPATLNAKGTLLRTYVIHRFCRLYPAYWFSIFVFLIVELGSSATQHVGLLEVLVNLTMLQTFVGVPDVVGAYWTLPIELIFYGICALLFLGGHLHRRELMIAFALAAGLLCAWLRYKTGKQLPVALFIALALMFLGDSFRAQAEGRCSVRRVAWLVAFVGLGLVPICIIAYQGVGARYLLSYALAITTFLVFFIARFHISRARVLNRIGQFLADCSYSVYLLHGSIGLAFAQHVYATTGNQMWTAIWTFGVTIGLAYLTYRLIEHPGIRLGRRLGKSSLGRRLEKSSLGSG